mgnify:CR=1 FL=1
MKRFYHLLLPFSLLIVLFICLPSLLQAQGPDPCTDPEVYCPIDGGLTALLTVGVGYGIQTVRTARKSQL